MSFNVVPKLSFTCALSVSVSLYFNDALLTHGTLKVNLLRATENVDLLTLPENVKKEVLRMIEPVGEQIQAWMKDFQTPLDGHFNLQRKISWTPLGTVDYGRTAANCVSSGEWDDMEAFKLACWGSDPENIYRLWPIVKSSVLEEVSEAWFLVENILKRSSLFWFKFWVSYLSGQLQEFKRVNFIINFIDGEFFLFRLAVLKNNVGAARFFHKMMKHTCGLNKLILSLAERCVEMDRKDFNPSMFIFLVSHLNKEEVKNLVNYHKATCLIHLLSWPLLEFVVPMSELVWSDFPFHTDLEMLLQRVLVKIMQTHVPFMYENVFKELWLRIPSEYQREFFDMQTYYILRFLFQGYSPEEAIKDLFRGNPNAYQKFLLEFIPNASAVMSMSIEDNKYKAFKNILQQYFAKDLVSDFEDVYAKRTRAYINEYYGNELSSESLSGSE